MRAIWITKHGGPNVLSVRETPDPEPKKGEIKIRVKAAGLNFAEVSARQGLYPDAPKPPCVVGYEGAGIVEKLGEGVTAPAVGTRVMFMSYFGGMSDVVVVPPMQVAPIPASMSFEEGAAIPVNYLTAYRMLFDIARVRSGDRVLIHMAAGGVGTAALQLCKTIPNITTFGTASASKHDHVRAQGCDHPIDYRTKDYVEEIKRITNGEGVDYVFDPLGGKDWAKGYAVLREGGLIVCFGMANVAQAGSANWFRVLSTYFSRPKFDPFVMMGENKGVAGLNLGHMWHLQTMIQKGLTDCVALYEQGKIKPHLDGVFPFDKAADAFGRLEHGKNVGKVVLVPTA
jgi:NADPH:quinone reductase-like Zn-dependent oxidoreductase